MFGEEAEDFSRRRFLRRWESSHLQNWKRGHDQSHVRTRFRLIAVFWFIHSADEKESELAPLRTMRQRWHFPDYLSERVNLLFCDRSQRCQFRSVFGDLAFIAVVNMATSFKLLEWFIVWHFSSPANETSRRAQQNKLGDLARLWFSLWHALTSRNRGTERWVPRKTHKNRFTRLQKPQDWFIFVADH